MGSKYWDFLRKAGDAAIEEIKWPTQKARIARAFADRQDDLGEVEGTVADRLIDIERKLITADKKDLAELIDEGLKLLITIEAAEKNSKNAKAWFEKLSGDSPVAGA